MKKRKGMNRRKHAKRSKGWKKMIQQIDAASKRRGPNDKPSKGMKRFDTK